MFPRGCQSSPSNHLVFSFRATSRWSPVEDRSTVSYSNKSLFTKFPARLDAYGKEIYSQTDSPDTSVRVAISNTKTCVSRTQDKFLYAPARMLLFSSELFNQHNHQGTSDNQGRIHKQIPTPNPHLLLVQHTRITKTYKFF